MKALIFGISGQYGALLAKFLLKKKYLVIGVTRNVKNLKNLQYLKIDNSIKLYEINTLNFTQIYELIKNEQPNEIYNLSGQSSVGFSIQEPLITYESILNTTLYILESIKRVDKKIKYFNPSTTECFGSTINKPFDETSNYNPFSPYATAKVMTHNLVNNYKLIYGIYACTGILSNHESILRCNHFVTMKIINGANNIAQGNQSELEIGDISIVKDWGWAEEYVEAMALMLKQEEPQDFIIATGLSISIEEFLRYTFEKYGLDFMKHIRINPQLIRKNDTKKTVLNIESASTILNWKAKYNVYDVIDKLVYNLQEKNIK